MGNKTSTDFSAEKKRKPFLEKKMHTIFTQRFFWKVINILITRVGKSSRTETRKHLQNLKEK